MKSERGFSLAELVVLLAVFAIVTGFSIPMLSSSMHSLRLAADARNIASTLSYARLSATSQMTHYRLSFDIAGNEWRLTRLNKSSGIYELQGAENQLSSGIANSGIAFRTSSGAAPMGFPTTSSTWITFNSRGIPIDVTGRPTADNIIYISGSDDDYAVTVSLAGKVQIWRYRDGIWNDH